MAPKAEILDHRLSVKDLVKKYNIDQDFKKIEAAFEIQKISMKGHPRSNIVYTSNYHTLKCLVWNVVTQPRTLFSYITAALLITSFLTNRLVKDDLVTSIVTLAIIAFRTILIVYNDKNINNYYKSNAEFYPARIIKDKKIVEVDKEYLQIGNVLDLNEGDIIGADAILIHSEDLTIDTSPLSGKHEFIKKKTMSTDKDFEDAENVVLGGDRVISGSGKAVVVRVGPESKIGRILGDLTKHRRFFSPLNRELSIFVFGTIIIGAIFSMLLIIPAAIQGLSIMKLILLSVEIFLSLFPEGIPTTIKLLEFSAIRKLEKKNVVLRDRTAIEKFGIMTILTAAKSALSNSHIRMCKTIYDGNENIDIEMAFYDREERHLRLLERIGHIAAIIGGKDDKKDIKNYHDSLKILGDICAQYFVGYMEMPQKIKNVSLRDLDGVIVDNSKFKAIYVTGKVSSVLKTCRKYRSRDNVKFLSKEKKRKIFKIVEKMEQEGYDSLALALSSCSKNRKEFKPKNLMFECIFFFAEEPIVGLSLISNVLKKSKIGFSILTNNNSEEHLNLCRKMIGFHELFIKPGRYDLITESERNCIVSAKNYEDRSTEDKKRLLQKERFILYSCAMNQKAQLIEDLQKMSHVVSFIGSRKYDCRALSKSDLGICFNESSQLIKEASSAIIDSRNFETILFGIEEGRLFFINLKKAIKYVYLRTIPQLMPYVFFAVFGTPKALPALLSIYLNYFVELIPVSGFAYEDPEYNLLMEEPRNVEEARHFHHQSTASQNISLPAKVKGFINHYWKIIATNTILPIHDNLYPAFESGMICGIACMLSFYLSLLKGGIKFSNLFFTYKYFDMNSPVLILRDGVEIEGAEQVFILEKARSTFFLGLVICQFCNVFICRRTAEYFYFKFFTNYYLLATSLFGLLITILIVYTGVLNRILSLESPDTSLLVLPILAGILIILIDSLRKYKMKQSLEFEA